MYPRSSGGIRTRAIPFAAFPIYILPDPLFGAVELLRRMAEFLHSCSLIPLPKIDRLILLLFHRWPHIQQKRPPHGGLFASSDTLCLYLPMSDNALNPKIPNKIGVRIAVRMTETMITTMIVTTKYTTTLSCGVFIMCGRPR